MMTYICPICTQPLEEIVYTRCGEIRRKLICSDPVARQAENHRWVVYYGSRRGRFWSFGLKATPLHSAEQSGFRPQRKSTAKQRKRIRNRQRELSL
jgi:hypothetical protein